MPDTADIPERRRRRAAGRPPLSDRSGGPQQRPATRRSQACGHISLEAGETELILRVRDDSQGIAPRAKRGLGLRLMAYRAGMLGGTCIIEPAVGSGTLVECRIPHDR